MELIIEFILELLFEGTIELLPNKKVPGWIRYPLACLVMLLFVGVIAFFFLCGISAFKENILFGIFFIVIGIVMLIGVINKFVKIKSDIRNKN